ncbi:PIG-P-domain-containing protein [Halteromyces radiatus]|uniref:PIG-P-domain-containing protein n=1 Tax=Halteromyces radiatus TaxID=101107 RepID=UPI00221EFFAA|nr:PIG-P-domain-containing protein [Halteromyces radiatus]KAI8086416.1 PIG-P-domain-containing protein [Halteromyces radiatus]
MEGKDDEYNTKVYKNRLTLITTTLDQVNEEEDEEDIRDRRFRTSPLGTSQSAISLPALARTSYVDNLQPPLHASPIDLEEQKDQFQYQPSAFLSTTTRPGRTSLDDEIPKRIKGRRNSFSSFLSKKYAKTKLQQDQERILPIINNSNIKDNNNNNKNKNNGINNGNTSTKEFQKGHRPRSFSEVPAIPATIERAPPVAITNKTPVYEYYGFVMYLASFVVFGLYAIWAYVPDHILHDMGITYYPNRYWALAIPVWLMTLVWFIFISYMTINLMNTPPFDSYDCITDEHANMMEMDTPLLEDRPDDWMPELHDIPIGVVNAYLYQEDNELNKRKDGGTRDHLINGTFTRSSSGTRKGKMNTKRS